MDIANMLARLNAKNVRFDVGAGGTPDLLSPEIAGALAFVRPGIGRELLLLKYWPDGARLTEAQLTGAVDRMLRVEWGRRETVMTEALVAVGDHGSRAQRQYQDAHAQRWPELVRRTASGDPDVVVGYVWVRNGVLGELAAAGQCPSCQGRTEVRNSFGVVVTCSLCSGGGRIRISERERAEAAGFAWTTFRNTWAPVYDWAYQECAEALRKAERQLKHALSDSE